MENADERDQQRIEELTAVIHEVRDRVRRRYPQNIAGAFDVPLPDLLPVLHARDAAQAKVAAIGTVNPRPGGFRNSIIQAVKKTIARALSWHVREQVEFNRNAVASVEATLDALNEFNRTLVSLANHIHRQMEELRSQTNQRFDDLQPRIDGLRQEAQELKDVRTHWAQWRAGWEEKLAVNEVQFLRSVADLQGAFQHRVTLMESNFRDIVKSQHKDFEGALDRANLDLQRRFWIEVEKTHAEFERLIFNELRLIRQRAQPASTATAPLPPPISPGIELDALAFTERFRGSEEYVREKQRFYLPFFKGRQNVVDLGCGRGEFLELMREAEIPARGFDLNEEFIGLCVRKGLRAEKADLFAYLQGSPDNSLDGIFCAQVVEHLAPGQVLEFVRLAGAKLGRNGVLAVETPNPACLAILATHFYLDPTHTRPVPHQLLSFYMEESGFGLIEVHPLSPAAESMPALSTLPEEFRAAFFGGLDYAVVARKL